MSTRLATAEWANPALVEEKYLYRSGDIWLGRSTGDRQLPIGYHDDRHVCLVSGSRSGKGTSSIINNLCLWPGSIVVVDPKGENAGITVPRRGKGSAHCEGMGQPVHVLDPFNEALVDDCYRSRFNPLDALDPEDEETIDEAGRIADALVVTDQSKDPFWDESARAMVKGLILHVLTAEDYEGRRNLITIRQLIMRGDWEGVEVLRECGETEFPSAHGLLWTRMRNNHAFRGLVAGIADSFANMLLNSAKQYESVLQVANRNTEFIDSQPMQRCLEASDFVLSDLKTSRQGMSLYLSLPQRFMDMHYRWLRMMIGLTLSEMEKVKGRPASGHPVLVLLDEFAGLDRMKTIEKGVAQMAGHGVKLFFVLQSLEQLKATYKDNWETFLSNSGLRIFFGLDDNFSRDYVSKLIGETEVIREMRSGSDTLTESETHSHSTGSSISRNRSISEGTNRSASDSVSSGVNSSVGDSRGYSSGESWSPAGFFDLMEKNRQKSQGKNWSRSRSQGTSRGRSHSDTSGVSHGSSDTFGTTTTENDTVTRGTSRARTTGISETAHHRPLISPEEIGYQFARIDDDENLSYPGLALVVISGQYAIAVRRVNYFEDYQFAGRFEPHADYPAPLPYRDICLRAEDAMPYIEFFTFDNVPQMRINDWPVKVGEIVSVGDAVMRFRFGNVILPVGSPHSGIITSLPKPDTDAGVSEIFSLRYYETLEPEIDPFAAIAAYCRSFTNVAKEGLAKATRSAWIMGALGVLSVILVVATRNVAFVVLIAVAGYQGLRKGAKVAECKRILEHIEKCPLGLPGGAVPAISAPVLPKPAATPPNERQIVDADKRAPSPASGPPLAENAVSQRIEATATVADEAPQPHPDVLADHDVSLESSLPSQASDAPEREAVPGQAAAVQGGIEPPHLAGTSEVEVREDSSLPQALARHPEAAPRHGSREKPARELVIGASALALVVMVIGVAFMVKNQGDERRTSSDTGTILPNFGKFEDPAVSSRPNETPRNEAQPASTVSDTANSVGNALQLIHAYDLKDGGQIVSLAFSPDGHVLASAGPGGVKLWDVITGREIGALAEGKWNSVASSAHGILASGGVDAIKLWDISAAPPNTADLTFFRLPSYGKTFDKYVNCVAFSPDGRLLASGKLLGEIKVEEVVSGTQLLNIPETKDHTHGCPVAFSPDGRVLAYPAADMKIGLADIATGQVIRVLAVGAGRDPLLSLDFSPDGQLLASGGADGQLPAYGGPDGIKLWDVMTGKVARTLIGHTSWVNSVAFSPDGLLLASGGSDKTARIWDVTSGKEIRTTLGSNNEKMSYVTFSPDGRFLAIAISGEGSNSTVQMWRFPAK